MAAVRAPARMPRHRGAGHHASEPKTPRLRDQRLPGVRADDTVVVDPVVPLELLHRRLRLLQEVAVDLAGTRDDLPPDEQLLDVPDLARLGRPKAQRRPAARVLALLVLPILPLDRTAGVPSAGLLRQALAVVLARVRVVEHPDPLGAPSAEDALVPLDRGARGHAALQDGTSGDRRL